MQEIKEKIPRETQLLTTLAEIEDLAEKKTKIYSRLLTDVHFAKEMNDLSLRHEKRKEMLAKLIGKKLPKKQNDGGMSAMNGQEE